MLSIKQVFLLYLINIQMFSLNLSLQHSLLSNFGAYPEVLYYIQYLRNTELGIRAARFLE